MILLALDTSTDHLSVALLQDGRVLAEQAGTGDRNHAMTLMAAIRDVLDRAGLSLTHVDAFACTTGPGSYTGIRIGLATVKGMAFPHRRPACGVSSLETLAFAHRPGRPGQPILAVIEARNGRVYAAAWQDGTDGLGPVLLPPANESPDGLADRLSEILSRMAPPDGPLVLCGLYGPSLADRIRERLVWPSEPSSAPEPVPGCRPGVLPLPPTAPSAAVCGLLAHVRFRDLPAADRPVLFPPDALSALYLASTQPRRREPSPDVTLRPFREGDLQALAELERRCFAIPWSRDALAATFLHGDGRATVAVSETGAVLGYIGVRPLPDALEILNLAVAPEVRRTGIARRLLAGADAEAATLGRPTVLLEVRDGNLPARQLYRSAGFLETGRRRRYYADTGEDAILMQKTPAFPPNAQGGDRAQGGCH